MSNEQRGPLKIRPSVTMFASEMERRLREHSDRKGNQNGKAGRRGWRQESVGELIRHAEEEMQEVCQAMAAQGDEACASEAIDLANMAMMIWDNLMNTDAGTDPEDWDERASGNY